jgi:excisionase family DNA binding protein
MLGSRYASCRQPLQWRVLERKTILDSLSSPALKPVFKDSKREVASKEERKPVQKFACKNMTRTDKSSIETEWMGLRQLSQYANISERTLRSWIHAPVDALPATQVRGKILVRRAELDDWLTRHRVKPLDQVDLDGIVKDVLQGLASGR